MAEWDRRAPGEMPGRLSHDPMCDRAATASSGESRCRRGPLGQGGVKNSGNALAGDRRPCHVEIFFLADAILDLLGDPIPENWGKRGRPPHVPSEKNRQKVVLLLAMERTDEEIATALAITPRTLKKYYFRELDARRSARLRLEGALLGALASEAADGSVAANKEIDKRLQRHDLAKLSARVADRRPEDQAPPPAGLKAQRAEAAKKVTGKFAPPTAPTIN